MWIPTLQLINPRSKTTTMTKPSTQPFPKKRFLVCVTTIIKNVTILIIFSIIILSKQVHGDPEKTIRFPDQHQRGPSEHIENPLVKKDTPIVANTQRPEIPLRLTSSDYHLQSSHIPSPSSIPLENKSKVGDNEELFLHDSPSSLPSSLNDQLPEWRSIRGPSMKPQRNMLLFTKAFGLRHKSTVDWRMRDSLPNKRHWEKYKRKNKDSEDDFDESKEFLATLSDSSQRIETPNNDTISPNRNIIDKTSGSAKSSVDPENNCGESLFWEETVETIDDLESGYFYHSQILDHFYEAPSVPNFAYTPTPPPLNNNFRQYYHISSEFYKPGGPIILWIPGESPLHTLFLRRGLAYELANATSGLLVALEHRFYGNSIPRLQDSHSSQIFSRTSCSSKNNYELMHEKISLARSKSNTTTKVSNPRTKGGRKSKGKIKNPGSSGEINGGNNNTHPVKDSTKHNEENSNEKPEGLPLDLLTYLNVDQSIEDIAYFIDKFPELQPKYFENNTDDDMNLPLTTRWILAGCSYGGNLAAWTRQRYPSKIFAAFASSAPIHSVLDFYEYSTSQSNIIGKQCSRRMSKARDFLDEALLMTDDFMKQMTLFDKSLKPKVKTSRSLGRSPALVSEKVEVEAAIHQSSLPTTDQPSQGIETQNNTTNSSTLVSTALKNNTIDDKLARQEAKLKVLTWFSSDFAQDYSPDGEEVHAAGWIWWTVASAVQYNSIVTPPTIQPPKTAIDILCETIAQADRSGKTVNDDDDKIQYDDNNNINIDSISRPNKTSHKSLQNLEYARALASWFKYQQYFTPTRAEDLQPSDVDPNSVQNLAGVAWLWQTCSELGYLQTSQPSNCCCSSTSSPSEQTPKQTPVVRGTETFASNITVRRMVGTATKSKSQTMFPQPFPLREKFVNSSSTNPKPSCLPCPCSDRPGSKIKESMFSRLLTLEAAWQECESYFGATDSIQQQKTTIKDNQKSQQQSVAQSAQASKNNTKNIVDDLTLINGTRPLLTGYPDVEKNVNAKFRSWGIVENAGTIAWNEGGKSFEILTNSNGKAPDGQAETSATVTDRALIVDTLTEPPAECESTSIGCKTSTNSKKFESTFYDSIDSGSSNGGRYYFTNGENDPWKDLTLASTQAIEFMKKRGDKGRSKAPVSPSTTEKTLSEYDPQPSHLPYPSQSSLSSNEYPDSKMSSSNGFNLHSESQHYRRRHLHNHNHRHHYRHHYRHRHRRRRRGQVHYHETRHTYIQTKHNLMTPDRQEQRSYDHLNSNRGDFISTSTSTATRTAMSTTVGPWDSKSTQYAEEVDTNIYTDGDAVNEGGNEDESERNVVRIIPGASHCQDILYESSDLESAELREERQNVLKTFVRWIEIDILRQRKLQRQYQQSNKQRQQ